MSDAEKRIKDLEKQVQQHREEVERLLRDRREYLRISAHQLKSPLATIIFSAETLLGEYAGKLNNKQLRVVESIKRGSRDLQDLIMDILELERFRSGEVELMDVDYSEICLEAVDELREKIREKGIHFVSDIPRKSLIVSGNQIGLKNAVYNLLENAVKYTSREGDVIFTVQYSEDSGEILTRVEDSGIGIPEEARDKIFDEFYRAENARLFDKKGTGFGLTIVKKIIEICGGSIRVQSRMNEGTVFTFTLPLVRVEEAKKEGKSEKRFRKRIVVIGGVAAGPKAASRARRLDPEAKITVFEKGNFLAYSGCALPYYIAGKLKHQRELFKFSSGFENATEYFRNVKGIEIKNLSEVIEIDRKEKVIHYRDILTERTFTEPYDILIIATGSRPSFPNNRGIELQNIFVMQGLTDSERIKRFLSNNLAKDIVVLGGGNIGIETAEALTASGARVTIVEKEHDILPFLDWEIGALVRNHLELNGVRVIANTEVKEFIGSESVESVQLDGYRLPADLVIIATGFKPSVELAEKAGLKIGPTGAIAVNEHLQTSDESIYAAGDCCEVFHVVTKKPFYLPLGSIANKQGRVAGTNASGKEAVFPAVTGSIIIRVFEFHIAKTGLNEKEARKARFHPVSVYVPDFDRVEFIPESQMICVKMIADEKSRKLLGVQIVGKGDVAKRIDVASTVIAHGGTIDDIASLDLGYAPSYSKAIDNIIVTAHVMQNKLDGVYEGITAIDAQAIIEAKKSCTFIDVRLPREFKEERIPGVELIPLESLSRRVDEIPRDRGIILIDETGSRSYQASLILKAQGFKNIRILEGGLKMWPFQTARE